MSRYDKAFKEEAVRLIDEIGPKKATTQLGISYYTLQDWRRQRTLHGDRRTLGADEHMLPLIKLPVKSN